MLESIDIKSRVLSFAFKKLRLDLMNNAYSKGHHSKCSIISISGGILRPFLFCLYDTWMFPYYWPNITTKTGFWEDHQFIENTVLNIQIIFCLLPILHYYEPQLLWANCDTVVLEARSLEDCLPQTEGYSSEGRSAQSPLSRGDHTQSADYIVIIIIIFVIILFSIMILSYH